MHADIHNDAKHTVVDVLPFTLHDDQVVNVKGLGRCKVIRVFGINVNIMQLPGGADHWRDVIEDALVLSTTPVPHVL